jgi:hypothetical protein
MGIGPWTLRFAQGSAQSRTWRTRQDAFAGVGAEILLWLQQAPAATAPSLFERFQQAYPGRFPEGQLRTLQRRLRAWRRVMARKLGYACWDGKTVDEPPVVVAADKPADERAASTEVQAALAGATGPATR